MKPEEPGTGGGQADAGFRPGDLVEYLPDGGEWTVDEVIAATPYKPQACVLGRSEVTARGAVRGTVQDALPGQLRLICPALERTLHAGSDWRHLVQADIDAVTRRGTGSQGGSRPDGTEPGRP